MHKISVWSWALLLSWPVALGYGLAYFFPPKNAAGLVLGTFWLVGWLVVFILDRRSGGNFLVSSAPPQALSTGDPPWAI